MLLGEHAARAIASSCVLTVSPLLAAFALTFSGCVTEREEAFTRVPIEGTVTLDDIPLDDAVIRFIPTGQTPGPKTMFPIHGGAFTATGDNGPATGRHRVEIELVDEGVFAHDDEQALERLRQTPRRNIPPPNLPEKYHSKSMLTAELLQPTDDRPQPLEFSLSSHGR